MNPNYQINDAYEWLDFVRTRHGLPPCSAFGKVVATILTRSVAAIYNLPRRTYLKEWHREDYIEVLVSKTLATYDTDHLTQLVIQCHDACVRMEIDSGGPQYIKLRFHPRRAREGRLFDRHPTIEDAIIRARTGKYPTTEVSLV